MRARAVYLGLFATTLGFTLAAATRQFAPASSIGVSAKEIGSARNIVTRWQTSWGSFDRDYLATRDIKIEIHNLSQLPARIAIDPRAINQVRRRIHRHRYISTLVTSRARSVARVATLSFSRLEY
jgi:hypothetical protein